MEEDHRAPSGPGGRHGHLRWAPGMQISHPSWGRRPLPLPRRRLCRQGRRALGVALVTGLTLGFRDALRPEPDEPVVVVAEEAGEPPSVGSVTLYFHPEVPEATLVLVR
jgi:hypothetical protein